MKTIVWDVDDVLNDLMRVWLEQEWRVSHPECQLTFDELTSNPPHQLLKTTKEDYLLSLDRFRSSGGFSSLEPLPEVQEWFQAFGARYRHMALTAVPRDKASLSAEWVIRHFGDWIRVFHFVPSIRKTDSFPAYDLNKGEVFQRLKEEAVFIDDNEENVADAEKAGFPALLMPRPWNKAKGNVQTALKALSDLVTA